MTPLTRPAFATTLDDGVGRPKELRGALSPTLEAHEPPEARGLSRDGVRMLVGRSGTGELSHRLFTELPDVLRPGDLLVVNTSATIPAAVSVVGRRKGLVLHLSTELSDQVWVVELRRLSGPATVRYTGGQVGERLALPGGATARLVGRYSADRLWKAEVATPGATDVLDYLSRYGRPIRYGYVDRDWPLDAYQTAFATEPGSAEMPSAARPFTDHVVTRLVSAGVVVAPIVLHTGVASPEATEKPYPERYAVSTATARLVNDTRAAGARVIAVGTTVVRALESAAEPDGVVRASVGWTDVVITPERGVRVIDGLLTGFHEPGASHLWMLEAIIGTPLLRACYRAATTHRYLWHEFGDVNLLLP